MKKSSEKLSYIGQEIFVGIDVHKRNYSVVAVVNGTVVKKWHTSANPDKLVKQLLHYFPGASIHTVQYCSVKSLNFFPEKLLSRGAGGQGRN